MNDPDVKKDPNDYDYVFHMVAAACGAVALALGICCCRPASLRLEERRIRTNTT